MTMAGDGERLTGLWFDGQKYYPAAGLPACDSTQASLPLFDQTRAWLDRYFRGRESRAGTAAAAGRYPLPAGRVAPVAADTARRRWLPTGP